jgi:branched-chain amino acid transport system substrate-binding protein
MRRRAGVFVCMIVVAGLAMIAPQRPVALAQQGEPVKLGAIIGLTGPAAAAGNDSYKCMQIAVEEVNRAGGVLGRQIQLIVQDDEGKPPSGVAAANKLADVDGVVAAVGGYQSSIALPVGQVLNKKGVVWVTDATTDDLKKVGPYVFDTAQLADQAVGLVDFAKADMHGKRIAGLFENNPVGQSRDQNSRARAAQLGLQWVHSMLYQVGGKDFRTALQQLLAAKPDAILTDIYDADAAIIQRQLVELGVTNFSKFYSYNLGAFATLPANVIEGMKGINYVTRGPRAAAFTQKYIAKYGKVYTDAWAPPFYDAVWIVARAIQQANSIDRKQVRDAMWSAAYNYLGVSGNGDKGFNMWGKQAADQEEQLTYHAGKQASYFVGGSKVNTFEYRYPGPEGQVLQVAPTVEQLKAMYPGDRLGP